MKEVLPEIKSYTLENAVVEDVWPITHLINHFADQGLLVPMEGLDVYNSLGNFVVVRKKGKIIGCGQLAVYRKDIAELRSVCVIEEEQRKGIGADIVNILMQKANKQGISDVVIITKTPEFWEKMGFFVQGDEGRHIRIQSITSWDHGERRNHP